MLPLRPLRRLLLWLLPIFLAGVVALGVVLFQQALHSGSGEAWLAAWVLAFVVGLPLSIVVLALAGATDGRSHSAGIIPFTGEKIPRAGQ